MDYVEMYRKKITGIFIVRDITLIGFYCIYSPYKYYYYIQIYHAEVGYL